MSIDSQLEIEPSPLEAMTLANAGIVGAATIISLGGVASRVLGLVIETIIPHLFGASGFVSVFRVAETLSQTVYDFLVGGLVSAALVPVFSEYAERREELWQLVSVVLSALVLLLTVAVLMLELLAPQLIVILGPGYNPGLQAVAVQMFRLVIPAVFFLGLAGLLASVLYSLRRFAYPALTNAAYNLGIIFAALALTPYLGIMSLAVGILVGAASQVVLQWPGLRDARLRLTLNLHHPALRQMVGLYLPVLLGLSVSVVGVTIDRNLASRTGEQSVAWMQQATVLVQFPLGLVATAISFAILPNLSSATTSTEFRSTLALGLKLVLLLIIPATVGLYLLAHPVIALLFEHGAFTPGDTASTARALQLYLLGLPFAAVDQPLVFAFYARKNTLAPNLVAVIGVLIYLVVALVLIQPLGYLGLVLANSAQLTGHALVMIYLLQTRLGGIQGEGVIATALKVAAAAVIMGVVIAFVNKFPLEDLGFLSDLAQVLIPTALAGLVYLLGLKILRVREVDHLSDLVARRWRARRAPVNGKAIQS